MTYRVNDRFFIMKQSKKISLLLSPILSAVLFTACNEAGQTRDVYQSQEECLKDWNEPQLCERMNEDDEREYHHSHGVVYPVYWGPGYYGGDRTVIYQGREISPSGKGTTLAPFVTSSRTSSASRTGVSTPRSSSVSTGGFGGKGVSTGG